MWEAAILIYIRKDIWGVFDLLAKQRIERAQSVALTAKKAYHRDGPRRLGLLSMTLNELRCMSFCIPGYQLDYRKE